MYMHMHGHFKLLNTCYEIANMGRAASKQPLVIVGFKSSQVCGVKMEEGAGHNNGTCM